MKSQSSHAPTRWALAILPLILSGCASQQAVSEQSEAVDTRLARIEAALKDTAGVAQSASDQARAAQQLAQSMETRIAGQSAQLAPMLPRLARVEETQSQQNESLRQAEQQLVRAIEAAQLAMTQSASADRSSVQQAAQIAALLGEAQAVQARLAGAEGRLQDQAQRIAMAEVQLGQISTVAQGAMAQAESSPKRIEGKPIHTVILNSDQYAFPLNSAELDTRDMVQLDDLAARLKNLGGDYHVEIQGHTEDSGIGEYNYLLGEARAKAVGRYLHTQGGVPLHRISVISYGAALPTNGEQKVLGAKGNRRVVVQVMK